MSFVPLEYIPILEAIDRFAKARNIAIEDARVEIRRLLHATKILSICYGYSGHAALDYYWASDKSIETLKTGKLQQPDEKSWPAWLGDWGFPDVFVHEGKLEQFLNPGRAISLPAAIWSNQDNDDDEPATRAGPKDQFDWDLIWAEVCALIQARGLPSQKELIKYIRAWYATTSASRTNNKIPSEKRLQARFKTLYAVHQRRFEAIDKAADARAAAEKDGSPVPSGLASILPPDVAS